MAEVEDRVVMSQRELKRVSVIGRVVARELRQVRAAEVLGLSTRQVRRMVRRVRAEGARGLVHRARGRASNRRLSEELRERVLRLYLRAYQGFGPTLAAEKLAEREGIQLSRQTVRNWLVAAGLWLGSRKRRQHRQWRERKHCCGELVQLDGSHHEWLEGRGPTCVLMALIDDATSRVWARFYPYEGSLPALDSFRRYLRQYGIPVRVYLDRHTTYCSPAQPSVEDELAGSAAAESV